MPHDLPDLLCNLEKPDQPPTFAQCPLCRRVIEDIRRVGKSYRSRKTNDDGVVLECEATQ
jgi:hypothetical protein